ncbi:MAG: T9SS type A sorting domain-containing protein [Bacteroidia bacterium]|nr:T9SS type A sorting domain-containing protein [Bacteroidia bacterium]
MTRYLFRPLLACLLCLTMPAGAATDAIPHRPAIGTKSTSQLTTAYPNPFSDNTTIFYSAPEDAFVRVKLYNAQGTLMGQIYDDLVEKGATYQFELDGSRMLPGVYYYTIESEKMMIHQRLELVR